MHPAMRSVIENFDVGLRSHEARGATAVGLGPILIPPVPRQRSA